MNTCKRLVNHETIDLDHALDRIFKVTKMSRKSMKTVMKHPCFFHRLHSLAHKLRPLYEPHSL